jgi:hypothetical protein
MPPLSSQAAYSQLVAENEQASSVYRSWLYKFLRGTAFSAGLAIILVLTYQQCVWCVIAIMLFSALSMSCIPSMPLVFILSLFTLLFHAIDMEKASVKIEVPLENLVYIPTWNDFTKYVKIGPDK